MSKKSPIVFVGVHECRLCGFEWQRMEGETTDYCYGCRDAAFTSLLSPDPDVEGQFVRECADRKNVTEATAKRHWRLVVGEARVEARKAVDGDTSSMWF